MWWQDDCQELQDMQRAYEAVQSHRCDTCGREISHTGTCADCEREIEHLAEIARLRAGDGTPDDLADYAAARRMIQSGE